MQNGASKENAEQQALSISADFLTGSTELGLDRIRTRLLDLTNRNKLLNFRHSNASSLRVVDVPIDSVFRRLRDNEKLSFLPVPAANVDGGEGPSAKDHADDLGWNTTFDLDEAADDDNAKSLPVLHYQEKLDTVSRKIATAAKTAIEESGTNMLYLVFGFRKIPQVLRTSVDSKQVGQYLDRVLEIIAESERSGFALYDAAQRASAHCSGAAPDASREGILDDP